MILRNVPQDQGSQNPSLCVSVCTQLNPIPQLNSPGLKKPSFPVAAETILLLDFETNKDTLLKGSVQRFLRNP